MIPQHLMSECNIQAEFYRNCVSIGLNCTLELTTPVGRLDAAIFSDDWKSLLAVVECKHSRMPNAQSGQIARYKRIGVPVYGLGRMNSLSLAEVIKSANYSGIPWETVCTMPKAGRSRKRTFDPALDVDEMINFKAA